jgi:predicted metal-dependent hydrolase
MRPHIQFGSKKIEFVLKYTDRKSMGITVTSDLDVLVKAALSASIDTIKGKLKKKAPWIIKQQSFFLSFHPKTPSRKFVAGETHLYLGKQYRLKIIESSFEVVKLKGKFLELYTSDKRKAGQILHDWYLQNAWAKFHLIAKPLIERFRKFNVEPTSIVLREMPTRWGSCTPQGKIILNPELIKAPKGCIEYVIIHELCHLIYRDHTQRFLDLQSREMKDWVKWKSKLEKLLA